MWHSPNNRKLHTIAISKKIISTPMLSLNESNGFNVVVGEPRMCQSWRKFCVFCFRISCCWLLGVLKSLGCARICFRRLIGLHDILIVWKLEQIMYYLAWASTTKSASVLLVIWLWSRGSNRLEYILAWASTKTCWMLLCLSSNSYNIALCCGYVIIS